MKTIDSIEYSVNQDRVEYMFKTYFIGKKVYLKDLYEDSIVECHNYYKGKAVFKIPSSKKLKFSQVIYTMWGNQLIQLQLDNIEAIDKNIYLSDIIECTLSVTDRSTIRIPLQYGVDLKNSAYITSVADETMLQNSLISENVKITRNFRQVEQELGKIFTHVRCFTVAERVDDPRMEYFLVFLLELNRFLNPSPERNVLLVRLMI